MQENPYPRSLNRPFAVAVGAIAVAVALLDGVLKYIAITRFPGDDGVLTTPIALALHKNPGIVFDISIPRVVILPLTVAICAFLLIHAKKQWRTAPKRSIALIIIIVGAIGNGIDRLVNGFTTDYLIFFTRSAINLSDILIITGVFCYLYYSRNKPSEDTGS